MGVKLPRAKHRHWLASILYMLHRWMPLSKPKKLDLYLDLEWIAARLAHEISFDIYKAESHPSRHIPFLISKIRRNERVLDLGSGVGDIAHAIHSAGAEVVGIDHDPASISQARASHPQIEFVQADARDYLRSADKFDTLVLSHVLEHLDAPEDFLAEIAPQFSRVYIEVPDFEFSHLNLLRLRRNRQLIYQDTDHVSEFDREELKRIVTAAGLRITDEEYSFGAIRLWCGASDSAG